jgi:transcriptional regulator with GAF, ATPase, and Fis domain
VGLLGLIGTQGHLVAWPVDRVRQFGDREEHQLMPIDPALLATSIGTLADLEPEPDLPASLQRAVTAAKRLFDADAAGITLTDATGGLHWASGSDQRAQAVENAPEACAAGPCDEAFTTGRPAVMYDAYQERRRGGPWGEISLAIADLEPRSALSVPIDLGDGPIGTLDLYATNPRRWDRTDVCALQTFAGVVARLLGAAATAHIGGWLADQLQVALASRVPINQARLR